MKQSELGEHLDLSAVRIRELARTGVIPRPATRGDWDADACRVAYIRHLRARGRGRPAAGGPGGSGGDDRLLDLKVRKETTAVNRAELELGRLSGSLVPVQAVRRVFEAIAHEVRTSLRGSASALAPMLVGLGEEHEIYAIIEDEIDSALRSLSGADARILSRAQATAPTDDQRLG